MGKTFTAEISHQGQVHRVQVAEDQTVLEAAHAAGVDLPTSCGAGVCTTCAALITSGTVNQADGMGVSPELQADGYALLCVAFPTSDLTLVSEKEDEVYARQFAQPG